MDSRAKQRLTGAVILVALFVLLVPELLTGPRNAPATTPVEEGLRRYTIDLDSTAPPSVNLPAEADRPEPAPIELAVPGEAAAPEAATPPAEAPRVTVESDRPMAAPATPAPAPPAAPASRPPAAPVSAITKGSFAVQLGSFSSRENADRLVRDMTAKGFATFIAPITTNGRELFRVRVGPTKDRAAAEALAAQLKRMGQSGSVVPLT